MDLPPSRPGREPGPSDADGGGAEPLALRVLSGAYEGSEYPLVPTEEIVIGRARDADLVLFGDDRASRRHARIWTAAGQLYLEDLGSTNGTRVNGERVTRTRIHEGDRIDIGSSAMQIVRTRREPPPPDRARERMMEAAELRTTRQRSIMRGQLAEVPLSSLLQLLAPAGKSGVIHLQREEGAGRVHLRSGQVRHAALDDWTTPPLEALYELMTWSEGTFEVAGDDGEIFVDEIDLPLQTILMECMSRLDEPLMDLDEPPEPTVDIPEPLVDEGYALGDGGLGRPPLEPRLPTGEELSLGNIPWRRDMANSFDREAAFQAAIALNGHTESDWEELRRVASTTLTWADALVAGFGEVHGSACRCAVLFEDGREPVGDDELQAWRDLIESWLAGILPGQGGDAFWRESWVAGLVHLSRGVRNVYLLSWMARLQRLFRARCAECFEPAQALAVADAFDRITDTAVALACESREAGIMESVSRIGINESLLRKIQGQAIRSLIDRERT